MKAISTSKMIRIEIVDWQVAQARISPIRQAVFIEEQNVPIELEWDGLDAQCTQILALSNDEAAGTARMTAVGKIGRMAVLRPWRRQGVGSQLLSTLITVGRDAQLPYVTLDAQVTAIAFYQRFGFRVISQSFIDAGIEHQTMTLMLE